MYNTKSKTSLPLQEQQKGYNKLSKGNIKKPEEQIETKTVYILYRTYKVS